MPNAHIKYRVNTIGEHYKFEDYYELVGGEHEQLNMEDESLWMEVDKRDGVNQQAKTKV